MIVGTIIMAICGLSTAYLLFLVIVGGAGNSESKTLERKHNDTKRKSVNTPTNRGLDNPT